MSPLSIISSITCSGSDSGSDSSDTSINQESPVLPIPTGTGSHTGSGGFMR